MKKLFMLILIELLCIRAAVNYAGDQDFTLVNDTGVTIVSLYVSPTAEDEWGDDILGLEMLNDSEEAIISFSHKESECLWDLKVDDEDGESYYWDKIDLCKYSVITLHYKKGKTWATFE